MNTEERLELVVEKLEALLDSRESEVEGLKQKLREYEHAEAWRWTRHRQVTNDEGLPIPRLEIRWIQQAEYVWVALYCLVYRHYLGQVMAVPIGETILSGLAAYPLDGDIVQLPTRDGVNIKCDSRTMGLPAFVVCKGKVNSIPAWSKDSPLWEKT